MVKLKIIFYFLEFNKKTLFIFSIDKLLNILIKTCTGIMYNEFYQFTLIEFFS